MSPISFFNRHPRDELSAYLDGMLTPLGVERLERHLRSCEACAARLEGLRSVRAAMQALPEVQAPRSFILTPEMAGTQRRAAPACGLLPLVNGLRLASAGLAVAFAVVLVIGLSPGDESSSSTTVSRDEAYGVAYDNAPAPSLEITSGERDSAATTAPNLPRFGDMGIPDATSTGENNVGGVGGVGPGAMVAPGSEPAPADDGSAAAEQDLRGISGTDVPKAADALPGSEPAPAADQLTTVEPDNDGTDWWVVAAVVLGVLLAAALAGSIAAARLARNTP